MSNVEYVPDDLAITFRETDRPRSGQTVSGYGRKLASRYMARIAGEPERRVYAICYSNAASHYVLRAGRMQFIPDWRFP